MFFQHIYDKTLAQASYIIGCQKTGEALVLDAQRDVDVYIQIAKQNKLNITHIAETHIHADFLCGSRELAALTGAKMYLSDEGGADWQYEFPHIGLKHHDKFNVGNLTFEVLHTPGHTPESISFLLTDNPSSPQPVMIFTGDFVFVGDIGRPDLLEKAAGLIGTKEEGAKQMFRSLKEFYNLPDYIQLWPAHGAGSACGKALGAVPGSTVGYEKIRNWAFNFKNNEPAFVNALLDGQPEPPKYFAMMKKLNKSERKLLPEIPKLPKLTSEQFQKAYADGLTIIDTRNKIDFANSFIPGTINIQNNNSLATFAGWFLNYTEQFVLIVNDDEIENVTRKLMRIGLDNIYGYVSDENQGINLQSLNVIGHEQMKSYLKDKEIKILDVRGINEYNDFHIEGAEHFFLGTIPENIHKLNPESKYIVYCQAGDRASIAHSLLYKNGFSKIYNYSGGINEWLKLK